MSHGVGEASKSILLTSATAQELDRGGQRRIFFEKGDVNRFLMLRFFAATAPHKNHTQHQKCKQQSHGTRIMPNAAHQPPAPLAASME